MSDTSLLEASSKSFIQSRRRRVIEVQVPVLYIPVLNALLDKTRVHASIPPDPQSALASCG